MKVLVLGISMLFGYVAKSQHQDSFQAKLDIKGGCTITLNKMRMHIDPATGGRIDSFLLDDRNILTGKDKHELYWGSTFWASPQKSWNSPNMEVLDKEAYSISLKTDKVILQSKTDPKTGIAFGKEIGVDQLNSAFVLNYIIFNHAESPVRIAPWEVSRVGIDGLTFFPKGTDEIWGSMASHAFIEHNMVWFYYDANRLPSMHNKFFSDGSEGWVAHLNDSMLFIKQYGDMLLKQAAPNEAEVEVYTNPGKTYVEVELQGPYVELKPGESYTWQVKWYLRKLKGMDMSSNKKKLVDFVRTQLGESIKLN